MRCLKGALLALMVCAGMAMAKDAPPTHHGGEFPLASQIPVARAALPDTWLNLLDDDFEGGFPGAWQVIDEGQTDARWGRWTCWSGDTPTHSVGCGAGGTGAISCGLNYDNWMATMMRRGPFDLSNPAYTAAELRFNLNLESEPNYDWFWVRASTDGVNFSGYSSSGLVGTQSYTLDLTGFAELGNLLGHSQVWISFDFTTDGSVTVPNGAQVDDVVLRVAMAATDNTLAVASASGGSGASVTLPLSLANDASVKGVQFDLVYNGGVATFSGASVTGRGAGMTVSSHVVSAGRARVVMYHDDAAVVAAGTGEIADLVFEVVGQPAQNTTVTLTDIILSDADGQPLAVTADPGTITVAASTQAPSLQLAVLKNPGRTRTLQILVNVTNGSGNLPTVTAGGAAVTMTALGGNRYLGTYAAANDAASVVVTAADTNNQGPGSGQTTVTF